MSDLIFVLLTVVFFVLASLLGRWCERAASSSATVANSDHR